MGRSRWKPHLWSIFIFSYCDKGIISVSPNGLPWKYIDLFSYFADFVRSLQTSATVWEKHNPCAIEKILTLCQVKWQADLGLEKIYCGAPFCTQHLKSLMVFTSILAAPSGMQVQPWTMLYGTDEVAVQCFILALVYARSNPPAGITSMTSWLIAGRVQDQLNIGVIRSDDTCTVYVRRTAVFRAAEVKIHT